MMHRRRPSTASTAAVFLALATVVAAGLVEGACLNVDPVDFHPPPDSAVALDTAVGESSDADADAPLGCRECVERPDDPGPGCGDEVKACRDEPKCSLILDCIYATGCFYLKTRKDFIVCAIPCAAEAGVVTTADPVVGLGIAVATCADGKCRAFCGGGDAGT
ncbi:MAG: hypothetical protein NVS3B10_08060 [Polyangiales bacterium]